jgi:hypothetical protein
LNLKAEATARFWLWFGAARNRIARMKPERHYPSMPAGVARIERIEAAVEPLFSQQLPPAQSAAK